MQFLLVSNLNDDPWVNILREMLHDFGILETENEDRVIERIIERDYDAIIIDSTGIKNSPLLVQRMLVQNEENRILVVSALPAWEIAREVFLSGALDYLTKSTNKDTLKSALKDILNRNKKYN